MHIAICDDNTADRHQMERLLKRESDKRASSTGILYIDSFGNCDALLANPMRYDAYYIDICKSETVTGADVVTKLTEKGVNEPIILCCSDIDYRKQSLPENVIFLDKPIKTDELSESIDHALFIKSQAIPQIELRDDKDTYYVTEPDILYAVETKQHVTVTLADGRQIMILTDVANFFEQVEQYDSFFAPTGKVIINGRHINSLEKRKATMVDGMVFKIHRDCMGYAKKIFEEFHTQ